MPDKHRLHHAGVGGQAAELFAHLWHVGGADRLGDLVREADQEFHLHREPDLRLVVLEDVAGSIVELGAAHVGIAMHEHAVPWHLDVVEVDQRIVLVEPGRQRVVVDRDCMRLVAFARQHAQARGVHRQGAGECQGFLARFQRLQIGDEHLVGHDRAGAEHLGAADGQSGGVLIDDLRDQLFRLVTPVPGAIGLRIDDHIGQIQVVSRGIVHVVFKRLGARRSMLRKTSMPMRWPMIAEATWSGERPMNP